MKKSLLLILLLPFYANAQTSLFFTGGISTNTIGEGYARDTKRAFAPSFEIGIFNKVTPKGRVGIVARYGSFSARYKAYDILPNGGYFMDEKKYTVVKNMFTGLITVGNIFTAGKVDISPCIEGGLYFDKTPRFVIGLRADAIYNISNRIGIMGGISADYYSLKVYPGWYFAGKIGASFRISSDKKENTGQ